MTEHHRLSINLLIFTCCAVEAVLFLSDQNVLFPQNMRPFLYFYGAFWPGLLDNWKPNYAAQPYTMFITHGFLHAGVVHLAVNMITLWSLGRAVVKRVGQRKFILLYILSALGGGIGFAYLAEGVRPMVGASGALFGLLGAIMAWEFKESRGDREALRDYGRIVAILFALNLILWWAMDGQLAWQAHFGGFLVGWIAASFLDHKPTHASRSSKDLPPT